MVWDGILFVFSLKNNFEIKYVFSDNRFNRHYFDKDKSLRYTAFNWNFYFYFTKAKTCAKSFLKLAW
jgi:hypothetical protein